MLLPPLGWYFRLSQFFKQKFGEKVYKIPLDAGLSCPNRDGSVSTEGCIYCSNAGFSPAVLAREIEGEKGTAIKKQVAAFQLKTEKKNEFHKVATFQEDAFCPERKYLAYFQSYSNTYADTSYLKHIYEEALSAPGVVGLSIATRPDCLADEILELLTSYALDYHIWLELGLQSSHDRTLELINRGHNFAQFKKAVKDIQNSGIYVCAHVINGLPGESREDMLETIEEINVLPLQGLKFHQLQIVKSTALENLYRQGKVKVLQAEEYLQILCDQLESLRRNVVIHRLLSEITNSELLIAPCWNIPRASFSQMVEKELKVRGSYQGKKSLS